jgi:septal ring factor EnvC (AmiA/AmiB activator)
MKRIVYVLGLSVIMSGVAFADGNAFTPLNFNDTAYTAPATSFATQAANAISEAEAIGNGNIQNAIAQLENAQVDIRNDLLNCKTKFADVDAQYKLIKAERASLKKQVKTIEKRIKDIDNAKEKIRKNML